MYLVVGPFSLCFDVGPFSLYLDVGPFSLYLDVGPFSLYLDGELLSVYLDVGPVSLYLDVVLLLLLSLVENVLYLDVKEFIASIVTLARLLAVDSSPFIREGALKQVPV